MSTLFSFPAPGRRQGYAIALSLLAVLGSAAEPARGGETPISNTASLKSPLASVTVPGSKPKVTFFINYGDETGGSCGLLTKVTTYSDGVSLTKNIAIFGTAGHPGCHPNSVSLSSDGTQVIVGTESGGANDIGVGNVYDASTGDLISTLSFSGSGGSLEVGITLQPPANAPLGRADHAITDSTPASTNLYLTTGNAIYEATLTSSGTISTPQLIFAFPLGPHGNFGSGGAIPYGPAVIGPDGNLYGTTNQGGSKKADDGVVYELAPVTVGTTTTWTETVLHTFTGGADGGRPVATVAFDSIGNLYGTTTLGGMLNGTLTNCTPGGEGVQGCGVVFELLNRGSTAPWPEKVLWSFSGGADGAVPEAPVVLDAHNYIYGTTFAGGNINLAACSGEGVGGTTPGCGVVFKLTSKKVPRTETVLYAFMDGTDGAEPEGGPLTLDGKDIFGTTVAGGDPDCPGGLGLGYAQGCGVVFEITP